MVTENLDRIEKQIAQDKKELNDILVMIRGAGNTSEDPAMSNRIRNIQDNIYYLQAQLDIAKREMVTRKESGLGRYKPVKSVAAPNPFENNPTEQKTVPNPFENNPTEQKTAPNPFANNPTEQKTVPNPFAVNPTEQAASYVPRKEPEIFTQYSFPTVNSDISSQKPERKSSTEEIFGKNIMAIAAAGLIFISIVLFAIVFIPSLGTAAKIFMMFSISFAFLIAGIYLQEKKGRGERNSFFSALSGCGIGAIFVSLFLTNVYFGVLDDTILYVFLLVWAAVTLFLSLRYESRLFSVIGQIGITISIAFGALLIMGDGTYDDFNSKTIILLLYFFIGSISYLYFDIKSGKGYVIGNVFHVIDLALIIFLIFESIDYSSSWINKSVYTFGILLIALDALFMLSLSFIGWEKVESVSNKLFCGIAYTACLIAIIKNYASNITSTMHNYHMIKGLLYAVLGAAVLIILEYRLRKRTSETGKVAYWAWVILLGYLLSAGLEIIPGYYHVFGMSIAVAAFVLYGYIAEKEVYRIIGYVSYVAYLKMHFGEYYVLDAFIAISIIIGAMYIMFVTKRYDMQRKVVLYLLLAFGMIMKYCQIVDFLQLNRTMQFEEHFIILFAVLAVINTAATLSSFRLNWVTGDDEVFFIDLLMVINGILLFFGMRLLYIAGSSTIWIVTTVILAALACVNIRNKDIIFKDFYHIYTGLKFTVLIYVILDSASAAQAVISIACFALAIICITLGFYKYIADLRKYGLFLAMVCVIKLIMFDIAYDNTLEHAISFFVSGLLCFTISAIYNYVGKRMNK